MYLLLKSVSPPPFFKTNSQTHTTQRTTHTQTAPVWWWWTCRGTVSPSGRRSAWASASSWCVASPALPVLPHSHDTPIGRSEKTFPQFPYFAFSPFFGLQTLDYLRHRGAPLKVRAHISPQKSHHAAPHNQINSSPFLLRPSIIHQPKQTQRLLLLVDARHGLKHQDRVFLQQLYAPPSEEEEEENGDGSAAAEVVWDSDEAAAEEEEEEEDDGGMAGASSSTSAHDDEEEDEPREAPAPPSPPLPPFKPPKLQLVFTKCDLLPRDELARRILLVRRELEGDLDVDLGIPRSLVAGLPSLMVAAGRGRKGLAELQVGGFGESGGIWVCLCVYIWGNRLKSTYTYTHTYTSKNAGRAGGPLAPAAAVAAARQQRSGIASPAP